MKKIVAIFIALLLLFNTEGMLVFYWGEMERCESLAENKIIHHEFNEDALIVFSSANKDFQIIEDHEVFSNGILYDIVKKETKDGDTIYSCFSDKKESGFWNGISQLAKGNSEHSANPVKNNAPEVLKYIGQDKFFDHSYIYALNFSRNVFLNNDNLYKDPFKEIFAPPPQV